MSNWLKYFSGVFVLFCIWLNIFQSFQAQVWGGFETSNMTKKYYFKIFGESDVDPDWKVYLDNKDAKMGAVKKSTPLFNVNFENELGSAERLYKGSKTVKITKGYNRLLFQPMSSLKKGQRLRAEIMVSGNRRIWNRGKMTNFHIQLLSKGKVVRDQSVRLQDVSRDKDWKPIHVDIKVKQDDIDQIKVLTWSNYEENVVFIDDLKVSIIE